MKRAFCIFLSSLILVCSCGISLAFSYCKMSEKLIVSLEKSKCCCGDKKDSGCCKHGQISLEKIKDNYIPASGSKIPAEKIFLSLGTVFQSFEFTSLQREGFFLLAHAKAPPGYMPVPRPVLFRSLLI